MADPKDARTRTAQIALLAAAAVAFVLLRAPYLSVPLERDEGEYAYIAWRLLEGDVPYRDAFDQKPPGVFFVYAAAFWLGGDSIEGIHLALHAFAAGTALVLFGLVRRLAGGLAAAFAVGIFAAGSSDPRLTSTAANTEMFMLLPGVAATACLLRALAAERARWWLLCGVLAGAACWLKQVAVTHALFLALFAAGDLARRAGGLPVGRIARAWGLLAVGAAAASAPILAFFAARGAWTPFVDAVLLHNLAYSSNVGISLGLANLGSAVGRIAPSQGPWWALALAALLLPLAPLRARVLLGGFAAASGAGLAAGLYFRPHYFVQALPPLAGLAGIALAAGARPLLARAGPVGAVGVTVLALAALAPPAVASWPTFRAPSPASVSRHIYGLNPFPESLEIGRYLQRTSGPEETVYVVGSEPQILFYARRRSATRYIFFYPLLAAFGNALERQQEVAAEVAASRPRYVVGVNIPTSLLLEEGSEHFLLGETARMLEREYQLEFVSHPVRGAEAFEFTWGVEARGLMRAAGERAASAPWVAVYRRRLR